MIPPSGARKDLFTDHLWRQGAEETRETLDAIEYWKSRVGPAYNKGGLQLLTEGHNLKTDGKRR